MKLLRAGDEHNHDFAGLKAALDEHMAQKAAPGDFVIRCHFEIAQQAADIDDDAVGNFVLARLVEHLLKHITQRSFVEFGSNAFV